MVVVFLIDGVLVVATLSEGSRCFRDLENPNLLKQGVLAIVALGTFEFIVPKCCYRLGKMEKSSLDLLPFFSKSLHFKFEIN